MGILWAHTGTIGCMVFEMQNKQACNDDQRCSYVSYVNR